MAIGIPLSSLDVVVGISGVHYVLQGMRQIDREMSTLSGKRVAVAMDTTALASGFQRLQAQSNGLINSVVNSARQMDRVLGTIGQGAYNPMRASAAREVIQQYQQMTLQARVYGAQAAAATRQAVVAEKEHQTALKERTRLQNELNRAVNAEKTITDNIARIDRSLAVHPVTGMTQIRQNLLATTVTGQRTTMGTAAQQAAATLQFNAMVAAAEAKAAQERINQIRALPMASGRVTSAATALAGGPTAAEVGLLASVAQAARNNATALGNQASAARLAAAGMAGAAQGATQYLRSIVGMMNPLQLLGRVLGGLVSFAGSLVGVAVNIGKVGLAAGGAVLNVGKFVVDILRIPAIAGTLTGGLSLIADNFVKIAGAIGLVITTLAGLTFKQVISEGMDLEQSFSDIRAVAQYSVKGTPQGGEDQRAANIRALNGEMERLDFITLKLGADTIFSNTEVAQSIEALIRGGMAADAVTYDVDKSVLDLASATKSSVLDASNTIVALVEMFGGGAEDIARYSTIIAGSLNTTTQTLPEFKDAMRQLGPLAQALGITFEDAATAIDLLANKGLKGELPGTALRNLLLYLSPRTKPAIAAYKEAGLWVNTSTPTRIVSEEDQQAYDEKLAAYNTAMTNYQIRMRNYEKELADFRSGKRKTEPTIPVAPKAPTAPKGELSGDTGHTAFFDDQGNLKPLPDIIRLIQTATKGMSDEEKQKFVDATVGKRSGAAALIFSTTDADAFEQTRQKIQSVSVADQAAARLANLRGVIELLTGSLKSLAGIVFVNWLATPLTRMVSAIIPAANKVLDFFGEKQAEFGNKSKAQYAFSAIGRGVRTGDLGGAWIDVMKTVPGQGATAWAGWLRTIMRGLQLARDAVITFKQAVSGNWWGAATNSINGFVRVVGVLGTYWGTIWRGLGQLAGGQITFKQFIDLVIGGFQRLVTEVRKNIQIEWPSIQGLLAKGWDTVKDIGVMVWNNYLQPALAGLWTSVTDYLGDPKNQATAKEKITGWFNYAKDFLNDTIAPWVGNVSTQVTDYLGKEETRKTIADAIGTAFSEAWKAVTWVYGEIPIDWKIAFGLAGLTRAVAGATTAGIVAGVVGLGALLAPGIMDMEKGFNEFWKRAFDPTGKSGNPMDVFKDMKFDEAVLGNPFVRMIMAFAAATLMIQNMLMVGIANGMLLGAQKGFLAFMTLADKLAHTKIGQIMGLTPLSQKDWDIINKALGKDFLTVDFSGLGPLLDPDGTRNQPPGEAARARMGQGMGAAANAAGWLANQEPRPSTGPRMVNEYDPVTGQPRTVDEKVALPRRQNPVTGQLAPEGYMYVYNPAKLAWELSETTDPLKPSVNPVTGQVAPTGYKWVFDGKTMHYAMYPIGMQDIPTAVPNIMDTTPEGMYWVWDPKANTYVLIWSGQKPPSIPPVGITTTNVIGAATGYGNEPYDDAGNPNPYYQPPLNPPGPNDGNFVPTSNVPATSADTNMGRSGGPATALIQVDASGLTDEMFLNKLTDRLEAKWRQLNGTGATA